MVITDKDRKRQAEIRKTPSPSYYKGTLKYTGHGSNTKPNTSSDSSEVKTPNTHAALSQSTEVIQPEKTPVDVNTKRVQDFKDQTKAAGYTTAEQLLTDYGVYPSKYIDASGNTQDSANLRRRRQEATIPSRPPPQGYRVKRIEKSQSTPGMPNTKQEITFVRKVKRGGLEKPTEVSNFVKPKEQTVLDIISSPIIGFGKTVVAARSHPFIDTPYKSINPYNAPKYLGTKVLPAFSTGQANLLLNEEAYYASQNIKKTQDFFPKLTKDSDVQAFAATSAFALGGYAISKTSPSTASILSGGFNAGIAAPGLIKLKAGQKLTAQDKVGLIVAATPFVAAGASKVYSATAPVIKGKVNSFITNQRIKAFENKYSGKLSTNVKSTKIDLFRSYDKNIKVKGQEVEGVYGVELQKGGIINREARLVLGKQTTRSLADVKSVNAYKVTASYNKETNMVLQNDLTKNIENLPTKYAPTSSGVTYSVNGKKNYVVTKPQAEYLISKTPFKQEIVGVDPNVKSVGTFKLRLEGFKYQPDVVFSQGQPKLYGTQITGSIKRTVYTGTKLVKLSDLRPGVKQEIVSSNVKRPPGDPLATRRYLDLKDTVVIIKPEPVFKIKTFSQISKPIKTQATINPVSPKTDSLGVVTILKNPEQKTDTKTKVAIKAETKKEYQTLSKQETFKVKAQPKQKVKQASKPLYEQRFKEFTESAVGKKKLFVSGAQTKTKSDSITKAKTSITFKTKIDVAQKSNSLPKYVPAVAISTVQAQSVAQMPKQDYSYKYNSLTTSNLSVTKTVPKANKNPKTPRVPNFDSEQVDFTFKVFGRRRGEFKQIGTATTQSGAERLGKTFATTTAGASFKITTSTGQTLTPKAGGQFRLSTREQGVLIQRRSFRISTGGEKKEITFKGIQSSKKKKRRGLLSAL